MSDPPILGLDIDEVLTRRTPNIGPRNDAIRDPQSDIDRSLVAVLNSGLPLGCEVVIVSGWRRSFDLSTLRSILADVGLVAPVADVVGGLKMSGDLRCEAFEWWVKTHCIERFAVIDDTPEHYGLRWFPRPGAPGARVRPRSNSDGEPYTGSSWLRGHLVCPVNGITVADADALRLAFDGHHFDAGGFR